MDWIPDHFQKSTFDIMQERTIEHHQEPSQEENIFIKDQRYQQILDGQSSVVFDTFAETQKYKNFHLLSIFAVG